MPHSNHGRPWARFWGSRQLSPFGGGVRPEGSIDPPPPPEVKARPPLFHLILFGAIAHCRMCVVQHLPLPTTIPLFDVQDCAEQSLELQRLQGLWADLELQRVLVAMEHTGLRAAHACLQQQATAGLKAVSSQGLQCPENGMAPCACVPVAGSDQMPQRTMRIRRRRTGGGCRVKRGVQEEAWMRSALPRGIDVCTTQAGGSAGADCIT